MDRRQFCQMGVGIAGSCVLPMIPSVATVTEQERKLDLYSPGVKFPLGTLVGHPWPYKGLVIMHIDCYDGSPNARYAWQRCRLKQLGGYSVLDLTQHADVVVAELWDSPRIEQLCRGIDVQGLVSYQVETSREPIFGHVINRITSIAVRLDDRIRKPVPLMLDRRFVDKVVYQPGGPVAYRERQNGDIKT